MALRSPSPPCPGAARVRAVCSSVAVAVGLCLCLCVVQASAMVAPKADRLARLRGDLSPRRELSVEVLKEKDVDPVPLEHMPRTVRFECPVGSMHERHMKVRPLRSLEDTELFGADADWDAETNRFSSVNVAPGDCFYSRRGYVYCLPLFAVVGAQKGGTSNLVRILSHSCLLKPMHEPHFFDHVHSVDELSTSWREYLTKNFLVPDPRMVLKGQVPFFMDKSPNYTLNVHQAAEFSSMMLPSLKSVMVLRNPTSRAYSEFQHHCGKGFVRTDPATDHVVLCDADNDRACGALPMVQAPCPAATFENHITNFHNLDQAWRQYWKDANADEGVDPGGLVTRGYYQPQIEHWVSRFPDGQLLVLFSEDMAVDQQGGVHTIGEFVGLSFKHVHNKDGVSHGYEPLSPEMKQRLDEHFCEANRGLESVLQVRLPSNWACHAGEPLAAREWHWTTSESTMMVHVNQELAGKASAALANGGNTATGQRRATLMIGHRVPVGTVQEHFYGPALLRYVPTPTTSLIIAMVLGAAATATIMCCCGCAKAAKNIDTALVAKRVLSVMRATSDDQDVDYSELELEESDDHLSTPPVPPSPQ